MTLIIEQHEPDCHCSYCGCGKIKGNIHYGLNIPANWKAPNSWWVIKYWSKQYLRWTNSWLRRFNSQCKEPD